MSLAEIVVTGEAVSVSIRGMAEPVTVMVCRVLGVALVSCGAASVLAACAHAVLAIGVRRNAAKAQVSLLRFMVTTLTLIFRQSGLARHDYQVAEHA
jgi:hypothetical protein